MLQAVKNNDSGSQQKSVGPKTQNTLDPLDDADINDSDLEDSSASHSQGISSSKFKPRNKPQTKNLILENPLTTNLGRLQAIFRK
jgi:hypothetical protein